VRDMIESIARSLEILALVGAFILAAWHGTKRVYRMARNIDELLDVVKANGTEARMARERLDLLAEEMATVRHRTQEIRKEVLPNGGGSLRDAVNRIETRVAVLETWHEAENGRHHGEQ
jgi:hypothetical protein